MEGRWLLSVTLSEYQSIRSTYPDFALPAGMAQINIIEITPDQLSVATLKGAITAAGNTTLPDLVVLRTTDTQNTITYADSADELKIDIPATKGAISIVGFGSRTLTLDAARKCRLVSVGSVGSTTIVNLGGMVLTNGNTTATWDGSVSQLYGRLTLANAIVCRNTTAGDAVYQKNGVSTFTNVVISDNVGSGICQEDAYSSLTNVTISGNTSTGFRQDNGGSTLRNVTIAGNAEDGGCGMYLDGGDTTLRNTIVARNASADGSDIHRYGGTLSGANNLIGSGTGQTSLVNGVSGNLVGTAASPVDPMLAEGTSAGVGLSPLAGSPAIDAGDDSLIPSGITTDIYGAARIQGARVNIGAVETVLPGIAGVKYVVTSLADSIAADGVMTLREALAAANSNQAAGDAPAGSYSSPDRIEFGPGVRGTILTHGQAYQILGSLDLVGPGSAELVLDGEGSGGVVDIRGPYDARVSGMTLTGGKAGNGGGISSVGAHLTLDNIVLNANLASLLGGGLYVSGGTSTLTRMTISGNTAGLGGGVYQNNGTSTMTNVTISGNVCWGGDYGGGGVCQSHGTSTLTNVIISGNTTSTAGGGICQASGTSTLTNVVISGNTAGSEGGGIYVDQGAATLANVTICGNSATRNGGGGYIAYAGTLTAKNTIVAGNGSGSGPDLYCYVSTLSVLSGANNLIGDGAGQTSLVNGVTGNVVGTSTSPADPRFVDMNGTDSTQWDLRLQSASPAVNAGSNAWIPAGVTTDITGGPRISGGTVDMGAYETAIAGPVALVTTPIGVQNGNVTINYAIADDARDLCSIEVQYSLDGGSTWQAATAGAGGDGTTNLASSPTWQAHAFVWASDSDLVNVNSSSVKIRITPGDGLSGIPSVTAAFTVNNHVNAAPTDIGLSSTAVAENGAVGAAVGTLSTTDVDAGDTFTYSLVSGTGSADNALFTIVGSTVKTAALLDYETKSSYSIRVRSTDQGGLWVEKAFTISVTNVNEAPVDIALSASSVPENQPAGTVVGLVSSTDPDAGDTLTYSLVSGTGSTDNASFTLTGGTLKTAASFNYEVKSSYSVRIRSTDQAGLWMEKAVTIAVTNVNETPTGMALSGNTIAENQPAGTAVTTLSTTDPDSGDSFSYSLVGGTGSTDNASFMVVGNTLEAAAPLDYEAKNSYSVRIRSTDQGGLWMERAFTIAVINVNDAPTNIALAGNSVAENRPAGTAVGAFSATDQDAGDMWIYSLVSGAGSTDNARFSVSGNVLKTTGSLDYEAGGSYSIRIRATDVGGLWVEKTFTVNVTNVDETPTDIALSGSSLAEDQAAGTVVGVLSTTDPDGGDTFTYSLVSGAGSTDNALFALSAGTLKTAAPFDHETRSSYSIRVRATDQGGLWTEKAFTIAVTNVNEAPTDIGLSGNSVAENQPAWTTVGSFSSTDPDSGDTFTYSLVSGVDSTDNGLFDIVGGDALFATASFNYEAGSSYRIRVRSTDQDGLWVEKVFAISVNNVNESPAVGGMDKSFVQDTTLALGGADFAGVFSDPDAGDRLQAIEVTALPTHGVLRLGGVAVGSDQVIAAGELGTLTYTPVAGYVGPDSFGWSGSDGSLYSPTGATVDLRINARSATTIVVGGSDCIYGQSATFAATVESAGGMPTGWVQFLIDGSAAGAPVGLAADGSATFTMLGLDAGSYAITANYSGDVNFDSSTGGVGETVKRAVLTVSATAQSKTYGQDNPTLSGTIYGIVAGDGITVGHTTDATQFSHPGEYVITPTLNDPNGRLANYTVTVNSSTLAIAKADQVLAWASPSAIVYGTAVSGTQLNATVMGVAGGSSPGTLVYDLSAGTMLDAGSHTLRVTAGATEDYNAASLDVTLAVNKAALTVSANPKSTIYGQAIPAMTGTVSGVIGGDDIAVGYITSAARLSHAGDYAITPVLNDPDGRLGNYSVTLNPGTLRIGKADQAITWAAPARILYGTSLGGAQLNATVEGIAGGSAPGTLTYSPAAGTVLGGGLHRLTVTAAATGDYNQATLSVDQMVQVPLVISGTAGSDRIVVSMNGNLVVSRVNGVKTRTPVEQVASIRISAGAGDDSVSISTGVMGTVIVGGGGNDTLTGGDGADVIKGGAGNDLLSGGAGDDRILGQGGDDTLYGGGGSDVLDGGAGRDVVYGQGGADTLYARDGQADSLFGGAGVDTATVDDLLDSRGQVERLLA